MVDWDQIGKKIEALRKSLGASQSQFGKRFGVRQATVSRWEQGSTVQEKHRPAIAELAGMTVERFFHTEERARLIPIIGEVSVGDSFRAADDTAAAEIQHIELQLGRGGDEVAVLVLDDAMRPAYRRGDLILGSRLRKRREIADALNASGNQGEGLDCIVKTTDGPAYVRVAHKTDRAKLYRLRSYNEHLSDKEVSLSQIEWLAPVLWVRRATPSSASAADPRRKARNGRGTQ